MPTRTTGASARSGLLLLATAAEPVTAAPVVRSRRSRTTSRARREWTRCTVDDHVTRVCGGGTPPRYGCPIMGAMRPSEPVSTTAPSLRPPVLVNQDWRDLTFLHWAVEPARVAHLMPPRRATRRARRRRHLRRPGPVPDGRRRTRARAPPCRGSARSWRPTCGSTPSTPPAAAAWCSSASTPTGSLVVVGGPGRPPACPTGGPGCPTPGPGTCTPTAPASPSRADPAVPRAR